MCIYTVSTVLGLQMNALLGPMMLSFAQGLPTSGSLHDKVRLMHHVLKGIIDPQPSSTCPISSSPEPIPNIKH